jgi:DNA-binding NtrC family response regulator
MKVGADDYLTKPFDSEELVLLLRRIQRLATLKRENWELREKLSEQQKFEEIIAVSNVMSDVVKRLAIVAPTDETILLSGESGTGKELAARCIHQNSGRADGPFVPVSCAALPRELLESELFGHEKGAFTGATQRKVGRFERAAGGTVFLDEVDDIPLDLQVKLLRVLQEREFERIGGSEVIRTNARVISATQVDLALKTAQGTFREDLYYRLNVIPIELPAIRQRREDIGPLLHHFLSMACPTCDKVEIASEAVEYLEGHHWPGNVRELKNIVSRLVVLGQCEKITLAMVRQIMTRIHTQVPQDAELTNMDEAVSDLESKMIRRALQQASGNKTKAAELLGMKPSTFRDKLFKLFPSDR